MTVGGVPVTKRLALTDREREPAHLRSTANLLGLPTCCHDGVGAPSAGAWRELRAHEIASQRVLDGSGEGFPLRPRGGSCPRTRRGAWTAPSTATSTPGWHGSDAVRQRLEALSEASADVVLLLEHAPQDPSTWLADRCTEGPDAVDAVLGGVATQLAAPDGWSPRSAGLLGHRLGSRLR